MAQMSDLPNEIILLILPLVSPDCIESFSGACKRYYCLAAEELETHRALKRRHGVYQFSNYHHRGVSRLLDEILLEPRKAFYVREITLSGWSSNWASGYADPNPFSSGFPMRLENALSQFEPKAKRRGCMTMISLGNEDHVVSLLLFLLPNLSKLRFEGFGSERAKLHDTLDRIARMKGPNPPLSSLRHVDLLCTWDVRGAMILHHFLALPAIRSVRVEKIGSYVSYGDVLIPELAPRSSTLEELTLHYPRISVKSLNFILKDLNALRSFTFMAERYLVFDASWFRVALFAAAPELESLTLLSRSEKRNVIGHLRIFESLRTLHTETQLLLDYFPIAFDEAALAKALPPNLQTLILECSGQGDEFAIAKYIAKLAELKKDPLPQLKHVEVRTRNGIRDFHTLPNGAPFCDRRGLRSCKALVKACHGQGFTFRVTRLEAEVSRDLIGHPSVRPWLQDGGIPRIGQWGSIKAWQHTKNFFGFKIFKRHS